MFGKIQELATANIVVDEHHCDQLLVYMAMAQGESEMLTKKPLSMHTETMLVLLSMFRPEISIEQEPLDNAVRIKIAGLGLGPDRNPVE